jgi:hypothetical protein
MRAKSAKERHERRRQKKIKEKSGNRSAANAHDGTQSLLHWAWEPSLSDTQVSLATEASASRPKRRRPKKPAPAKPALQLETEEDRTELLRRLQERQVAEADYLQVAIDAKRSARECETNSNSFTPTTRPLPSFYHDRLIMDGKRKPGQSRVDFGGTVALPRCGGSKRVHNNRCGSQIQIHRAKKGHFSKGLLVRDLCRVRCRADIGAGGVFAAAKLRLTDAATQTLSRHLPCITSG